ncbi:MAG TPA: hypothetical protein PLV83_05735 [Bacilli bacterium]|nr:hypothetical protein [Bacilli bacterium]
MKKIILILFVFVQLNNTYSQCLDGVYYTAYWEAIGKDSVYSQTMFYADFIDSKHFLYSLLFTDPQDTSEYLVTDSIVYMQLENILLPGKLENNRFEIIFKVEEDSIRIKHVYEKLINPINNTKTELNLDFFKNKQFYIDSEYGFNFVVNAENTFVFTDGSNDEYFGSTRMGKWEYWEYKRHYFMRYVEVFGEHIFHLVEKNEDNLIMETRDFGDKYRFPKKELVTFRWTPSLTSSEINIIENKIIGTWRGNRIYNWDNANEEIKPENFTFPCDKLNNCDSLINPILKITFSKDHSFNLIQEATIIEDEIKEFKRIKKEGAWSIGANGLFIQLNTNDKDILFLTIKKIDNNSAILDTRLDAFNFPESYIVPVEYIRVE